MEVNMLFGNTFMWEKEVCSVTTQSICQLDFCGRIMLGT